MEILDEKVNAHLPYYSTLKGSRMVSSKRFELMLFLSGGNTKPTSKPDLYWVVWLMSHTKS